MELVSIVFFFIGVSFLVWNKQFAKHFQILQSGKSGGWFIFYRGAAVFAGIILIIVAYALMFGPIYL